MNKKREDAIVYLCNGGKKCGNEPNCYVNGGDCCHTTDITHAAGFEVATETDRTVYFQKECEVCCSE